MPLNKEQMREYQRQRRLTVNQPCKPADVNLNCKPFVNLDCKPVNLPANYGQADCQCMHCQQNRHSKYQLNINHGQYKAYGSLQANGVNRQALPGDTDYIGVYKHA